MADSLHAFREQFFIACRDTTVDTEQLRATLAVAVDTQPALFAAYEHAKYLDKPQYQWDQGFFEQCLSEARENFSRRRLEYLLAVRDELRKIGARGFAPPVRKLDKEDCALNSSFHPKNELKKYFESTDFDLSMARHALRFEIYDASNDAEYLLNAVRWAESKASEIFEPYDVCQFYDAISENEQDWVPDYYYMQTDFLSQNFSKERFLHIVKVRQYFRDRREEGFLPRPWRDADASDANRGNQDDLRDPSRGGLPGVLRTAVMIGGAIAALLALLFSMTR